MTKKKVVEFPSEKDLPKKAQENDSEVEEINVDVPADETEPSEEVEAPETDDSAKITELNQEVRKLTKANEELEDRFLRSQAEMQNIQTRQKKEMATSLKYASQSFAKSILPAIDNLERALEYEVDDEASIQLKKGVQMTFDSLVAAFADEGITEINPVNEQFDPNEHQAVQTVPASDEHAADTVVQVFQKGYRYKKRVIRPAMVVVAQ